MGDKRPCALLTAYAVILLPISFLFASPEIFSPLSVEDAGNADLPLFIFRSEGACTLKVKEMREYHSQDDAYSSFSVYSADVTGQSIHSPDFIFSEGVLYAWYLEGFADSAPFRSECGYFMVKKSVRPAITDYRKHLIRMIFSESEEFANSVRKGYLPTGDILVNGVIPTNRELTEIIVSLRTSKKRICRERIK